MSASKQVKEAGLPNLLWVSREIKVPVRTLQNWHKERPALFEVVLTGLKERVYDEE